MKRSHIVRFVLYTIAVSVLCAPGCCPAGHDNQGGQVEGSSTSGSGGSGGAYSGQPCLWGGNGGGLTFPTCTEDNTSEFMGTIDGMPYHTKDSGHITAMAPPKHPPYTLSMKLADEGSLDLLWGDPYIRGQWTYVAGEMILPEGGPVRTIFGDSQILFSCDEYAFFI